MTDVSTSVVVRALVLGAVVAGTAGFIQSGKTVTVTVDGEAQQLRTHAGTVAEVLADKGIQVSDRDSVLPGLSSDVRDGETVVVLRGRLVTAQTGDELTQSLGARYAAASLTASRSARIPLAGLALGLRLPKHVTVVHDGERSTVVTLAPTVGRVLAEEGVLLDRPDISRPNLDAAVADGMSIRVVRVTERRTVVRTRIAFDVRNRSDSSYYRGVVKVVAPGRAGIRTTTYLVTRHDGKVVKRTKVSTRIVREPRARVVVHGSRARPAPTPAAGVDSLNWAALARCESGGNPRAVGGGGLYWGLYQFTLGTWRSVGGSGNPIDASAGEQTYRAKRLYLSRGSSPWPVCGRQLYS